jgi:hypothetical protein
MPSHRKTTRHYILSGISPHQNLIIGKHAQLAPEILKE